MKGDYGSLAWVNDNSGREFVCTVERSHRGEKKFENLTDDEKATCENVNQIVGTERW